jgi:hypothetical protein
MGTRFRGVGALALADGRSVCLVLEAGPGLHHPQDDVNDAVIPYEASWSVGVWRRGWGEGVGGEPTFAAAWTNGSNAQGGALQTGLEQATETLEVIHDFWKTQPRDERPRLYVHGLSLGALSSMHATNLFRLVDDFIDGTYRAGPPFSSRFWNYVQNAREPGSPWVLPRMRRNTCASHPS